MLVRAQVGALTCVTFESVPVLLRHAKKVEVLLVEPVVACAAANPVATRMMAKGRKRNVWNFLITMVFRVGGGANLPRTHLFLN